MGNVIYRRITNVYDIPPDILVNCIGKGLIVKTEEPVYEESEPTIPCSLQVDAGKGLKFDEGGRLEVDLHVTSIETVTSLTDVSMSANGRKFVLLKTYTDYLVKRNHSGMIVEIEVCESRIVEEDIILIDYGYCGNETSARITTPALPNFYQK
jgi:hypothetical protein